MPDFTAEQTEAAVVATLANLAADVRLTVVEGVPFLAVPEGVTLQDQSALLPAPKRLKAHPSFEDAESFSEYVNRYKCTSTLLVASRKANQVTAFIDYHAAGQPSWNEHGANLLIKHHEDFTAWATLPPSITQIAFGEFIEDHMHTIAEPDGAILKDMVLRFQALKDVSFKSFANLQNGDVSLVYIEDSERGTETNTKFPSQLGLIVPVYEGQEGTPIKARIRYRVKDQKLAFQVELVRKTDVLREAFEGVLHEVEALTGLQVLMGG